MKWTSVQAVDVQFSQDLTYQKSLKSVNFWQSYLKNKNVIVFWDTVYMFWPHFLWGATPTFYGRLLARVTVHRLAKFCWVLFADVRVRSPAIKYIMQNLRRLGKNDGPILSDLWTEVYKLLRLCRRTVVLATHLPEICITCFARTI